MRFIYPFSTISPGEKDISDLNFSTWQRRNTFHPGIKPTCLTWGGSDLRIFLAVSLGTF
jgi:hypothetical protein